MTDFRNDRRDPNARRLYASDADLVNMISVAVARAMKEFDYQHNNAPEMLFVRELIVEHKRRRAWRDKMAEQVGGWSIITFLGAIGLGAWNIGVYIWTHLK